MKLSRTNNAKQNNGQKRTCNKIIDNIQGCYPPRIYFQDTISKLVPANILTLITIFKTNPLPHHRLIPNPNNPSHHIPKHPYIQHPHYQQRINTEDPEQDKTRSPNTTQSHSFFPTPNPEPKFIDPRNIAS
jgi:hypothetical protein